MAGNSDENSTPRPRRRGFGRPFKPGQSGNPSGRPKGSYSAYIRQQCGEDGKLLADTLLALVKNDTDFLAQHGMEIPNTKELIQAIELLYDRGWGKAPQHIALTGEDGGPVQQITRVIVDATQD